MQLKLLIYCITFFCFGTYNASDNETMTWSQTQPLTWSDFKAKPNPNSHAVALTSSGITFGYSLKTSRGRIVSYTVTVECLFYPNKSWYKKGKANAYILSHEQLHFDITELYVRIFRSELAKLKVNQNIKAQLKSLHKSVNDALDKTQKQYDAETNHSINSEAQKQWEAFIKKELNKLAAFKS